MSDTPSYHSTLPPSEPPPSYSRPVPPSHVMLASTPAQSRQRNAGVGSSSTSMLPPATSNTLRGPGLPPIPDTPTFSQMPQLSQFRIPSWSSLSSNPQARHYQAVANRRVSRDTGRGGSSGGGGDRPAPYNTHHHLPHHHHHHQQVLRTTLERVAEDHERERVRPLEDPYLVGEEAAARARRERLARENADEILIQENRRWDLFLGKWSSEGAVPIQSSSSALPSCCAVLAVAKHVCYAITSLVLGARFLGLIIPIFLFWLYSESLPDTCWHVPCITTNPETAVLTQP